MNEEDSVWLAAEPWVHVVVENNDVLFYNTLNKIFLKYEDETEIAEVARELLAPLNGYVAGIKRKKLDHPSIRRLISDLRKKYMGELYDPQWSRAKPFNIRPLPVVKTKNEDRLHDLREITFHTSTCSHTSLKPYQDAHFQFPFPKWTPKPGSPLSPAIVRSVAGQIESLPFATLHFIGCGIPGGPDYDQLAGVFDKTPFSRKFHVPLSVLHFPEKYKPEKRDHLCLYVTFPLDQDQLNLLGDIIARHDARHTPEIYFIVRDKAETDRSFEIISGMGLRQAFFKPYLTGKNMQFFRDQVFISEDDIKASRPNHNQVLSRLLMNENDYGKLTILPDGSVHANLNDASLGNITTDSIADLVAKEIETGASWKRRRSMVTPCRNCLYHFLCPPVSNYEILTNRFNFCHIAR